MAGVKFTKEAAERTKHAVKQIERLPSSQLGQSTGTGTAYLGFWAKIVAKDPATSGKKYSWQRLEPAANNTISANQDWGHGEYDDDAGYALEVGESQYVLKDSIVWLYPALSQEYYLFRYDGGMRVAKTILEIPAKTDSIYGTGTVSIFKRQVNSTTPVDTTEDVLVFSNMTSVIAAEVDIQITYNTFDSCWWVSSEDCS